MLLTHIAAERVSSFIGATLSLFPFKKNFGKRIRILCLWLNRVVKIGVSRLQPFGTPQVLFFIYLFFLYLWIRLCGGHLEPAGELSVVYPQRHRTAIQVWWEKLTKGFRPDPFHLRRVSRRTNHISLGVMGDASCGNVWEQKTTRKRKSKRLTLTLVLQIKRYNKNRVVFFLV